MRFNILVPLFLTVVIISCNKEGGIDSLPLAEDKGCIGKITIPANTNASFSGTEYSSISYLFTKNGVNRANYRYVRSYSDGATTLVHTMQYANGLPIFNKHLNFNFDNGTYGGFAGHLTNGTSLNTTPLLRLQQLRKLFIDNAGEFEQKGLQYKDSCLKAEFGYYDLNSGTGNTNEVLVKSWKVTLKTSTEPFEYPVAYYEDNTGALIYYDNGIRTFH